MGRATADRSAQKAATRSSLRRFSTEQVPPQSRKGLAREATRLGASLDPRREVYLRATTSSTRRMQAAITVCERLGCLRMPAALSGSRARGRSLARANEATSTIKKHKNQTTESERTEKNNNT